MVNAAPFPGKRGENGRSFVSEKERAQAFVESGYGCRATYFIHSLGDRHKMVYLPRGFLGLIVMSYFGKVADRSSPGHFQPKGAGGK
jgi:hypothetical protein